MKHVLALLLLLGTSAAADVVILNDGTRLEGQLTRAGTKLAIILANGTTRTIDDADLKSIQKTPTSLTPDAELASLRKQIASSDQPGVAAGRLRDFVARHPNTAAANEAGNDLVTWQHRADAGLVRLGNDWVTRQQLADMKSQSDPAIENIRSLLAAGKLADAQKAIGPALKMWPANSSIQYLYGVALYRSKQLVASRQAFEAAGASDPSNPAIHNNIAVILWQTHQQAGALAEYDRAMVGDVVNGAILDNVDEVLHSMPPALASNALTRRVAARYEILSAARKVELEKQGLHRYGAETLDDATYQQRMKTDHANQVMVSSYSTQVSALQRRLGEIDRQVKADMDTLHSIDQQTLQVLPDGSIMQYPKPAYYADVANEVARLNVEKIMKTKELKSLPKQLQDAQASTGPRWTGEQRLIGEEAVGAPTTQPAVSAPVATKP